MRVHSILQVARVSGGEHGRFILCAFHGNDPLRPLARREFPKISCPWSSAGTFLAKPRRRKERRQKDLLCGSAPWRETVFRMALQPTTIQDQCQSSVHLEQMDHDQWWMAIIRVLSTPRSCCSRVSMKGSGGRFKGYFPATK